MARHTVERHVRAYVCADAGCRIVVCGAWRLAAGVNFAGLGAGGGGVVVGDVLIVAVHVPIAGLALLPVLMG